MKRSYFLQKSTEIVENQYTDDSAFQSVLKRIIPKEKLKLFETDLKELGQKVIEEIEPLNKKLMDPLNEPKLVSHNGWGERIDEIKVIDEWYQMHGVAAREGIISIGYDKNWRKKLQEYARVYQYCKLYLFTISSGMYSCPLAMTDGATRLIEQLKLSKGINYHPFLDECFSHLNSNNPKVFWTSGQWMTERTGGSDVSNSETFAVKNENSSDSQSYLLSGYKFFTSATTADITFTLAKIKDPITGKVKEGSRGLSLFVLKLRKNDGKFNNLIVHRLKDKFGTKSLPTAEIELDNSEAFLISKPGEGVKTISTLFNVTRIYCICSSAAGMRRMLALMRNYLSKREVFGESLMNKAAHLKTMAKLEIMFRGTLQFFLDVIVLFGKSETNTSEKTESLLRLLTPIGKLFTSKQTVLVLSEGMESFGGYGYMEDTGIPAILRDLHVNTIWEGTTNVLSLDLLRAITKDPKSIQYFAETVQERVSKYPKDLKESVEIVKTTLKEIIRFCKTLQSESKNFAESGARDLAFTMARCYIGGLLITHAQWSTKQEDVYIAQQWCTSEKMNTISYNNEFILNLEKKISLQSKL